MVKPSALCALLGLVGASFAATWLNAAVERRVRVRYASYLPPRQFKF
jgi:hypothetical protein